MMAHTETILMQRLVVQAKRGDKKARAKIKSIQDRAKRGDRNAIRMAKIIMKTYRSAPVRKVLSKPAPRRVLPFARPAATASTYGAPSAPSYAAPSAPSAESSEEYEDQTVDESTDEQESEGEEMSTETDDDLSGMEDILGDDVGFKIPGISALKQVATIASKPAFAALSAQTGGLVPASTFAKAAGLANKAKSGDKKAKAQVAAISKKAKAGDPKAKQAAKVIVAANKAVVSKENQLKARGIAAPSGDRTYPRGIAVQVSRGA